MAASGVGYRASGRFDGVVVQALADRITLTNAALQSGLSEASIRPALVAAAAVTNRWSVVERVQLGLEEMKVAIAIPFDPVIRFERAVSIQLRRRGVELGLVIPGENRDSAGKPDPAIIKAVGRALR